MSISVTSRRFATWIAALSFVAAGCGGGDSGGGGPTPPTPATVASVQVTAPSAQLTAGTTLQLTATPRDAAGNAIAGRAVSWSSSADGVATVANGLVTGGSPGTAAIRATADGKTGEVVLTVTPVPIATLAITPAAATVSVGTPVDLQIAARDAAGNSLLGRQITLSTSNPAIAALEGSRVVTLDIGTATITATAEGKTATATITVVPVPVATVEIQPATATLEVGRTQALTVVTRAAGGTVLTGRPVTFATSNAAIASLENGVVTAVAPGTATITATSEGKTATATITVIPVPIATLAFSPPSAILEQGLTQQMRVIARDLSGRELPGRPVTVHTSNPAIASIDANLVVEARALGQATLTATAEGKTATATITVVPVPIGSVTVTPASATIDAEATVQLTPAIRDVRGNPLSGRAVTWSSSDESVATVNAAGLVTGVAAGTATLTATSEGVRGTATITVLALPVPYHVSAGYTYTCGWTEDGEGLCWGDRRHGQLGDGVRLNLPFVSRPQTMRGGLRFSVVSTGNGTTCGVTTAGVAYCWGRNHWGQIGNGGTAAVSEPAAVSTTRRFSTISTFETFTCALETTGAAWCWGDNRQGQVGDGSVSQRLTPVEVAGGLRFSALDVGSGVACGVTTDGAAYCWGTNSYQQLGSGQTWDQLSSSSSPVRVAGDVTYRSISVGERHVCAIAANGSAHCWGLNSDGRMGNGTNFGSYASPVAVSGGLAFREISAGGSHTCAMTTAGRPYCWGANGYGQLGTGNQASSFVPIAVAGGVTLDPARIGSISVGENHSCMVSASGRGYCWGANNLGELGIGATGAQFLPTPLVSAVKL